VFRLGEITVKGFQGKSLIEAKVMEQFSKTDLVGALSMIPSVNIGNFGSKNEGTVYIRGFDIRQIAVCIDGIPVSLPYDGYVDLSRFATFDLSHVEIETGASSALYGTNTLGGAINMVGIKPVEKF